MPIIGNHPRKGCGESAARGKAAAIGLRLPEASPT